jgi:hypothetical protein
MTTTVRLRHTVTGAVYDAPETAVAQYGASGWVRDDEAPPIAPAAAEPAPQVPAPAAEADEPKPDTKPRRRGSKED